MTLFIVAISGPFSAYADASTSQGYNSKVDINPGNVVSVSRSDDSFVEPATVTNRRRIIGVVVNSDDSTIAIGDSENKVHVASTGTITTLVSNINGAIKEGDPLSISPIEGTAMLATTRGKIVGTADIDFTKVEAGNKKSISVTDVNGKKKTVQVARMQVQVNIQDWAPTGVASNEFLESTRDFISDISGKPVSNIQAFSVLIIALLALVVSGVILYSSVSSSVISIGRNPLSKGIVRRNLFYMIGLMVVIIIGASASIYLILEG